MHEETPRPLYTKQQLLASSTNIQNLTSHLRRRHACSYEQFLGHLRYSIVFSYYFIIFVEAQWTEQ